MRPTVIQFGGQMHLPAPLLRLGFEPDDMFRFERAAPIEHDTELGAGRGHVGRRRIQHRDGPSSDAECDHREPLAGFAQ